MNILITGGAGFIGRNLARSLHDNIVIYDNLSNSSKKDISLLIDKGAKFIKGDILDLQKLLKSSRGIDVVIHLAAKTDVIQSVNDPQQFYDTNVKGTINVLKCCAKNKIKKIIFASSAAAYGDCNGIITEKSTADPRSPYGKSKLDAEDKIRQYSKKYGFDAVILRLFNVYGNGQNKRYAGVISKFLKNISKDKPLVIYGNGEQTRDFVSIYDIVDAFACAIPSNAGTYNIASGKSVSINKLAGTILKISGKHLGIIHKKEKPGEIRFSKCDISLAKKELGFYPKISLKKGLENLVSVTK